MQKKPVMLLFLLCMAGISAGYKFTETNNLWSVRMAISEMKRNPEVWTVDFVKTPKWNYTQGLISYAFLELWKQHKIAECYPYARAYADKFIDDQGKIATYKMEEYNLDKLNSGKILFTLYEITGEKKYKSALDTLRMQLKTHPRTSDGGFWHKKIYPSQMWLDGIYMASPFLAQYAKVFNEPAGFDDVVLQLLLIQKHTFDPTTGLNFHGWDESKQQQWANPKTGCSPHIWGRAQGWYFMGMLDILDFLPKDHPQRPYIVSTVQNLAKSLLKVQDASTGLWYQILDQGNREGNYLESSCSSMFVYSLLKAVRNGYIEAKYLIAAKKGFEGINKHFIRENADSTISITKACAVAGLGGDPYRDGSFAYYINEKIRDDDPKAVGPYILACLEMEKLPKENGK